MFDVGASELLVIAVIAIIVIGPKDMPLALRTAGRWIGKIRRVSGHFRSGIEAMIREAEMEEMEKKWREQNAQILAEHPDIATADEMEPLPSVAAEAPVQQQREDPANPMPSDGPNEPQLPLDDSVPKEEG